jgi:hypothetical protein
VATLVYVLCALTSLACAGLLWRSYARTRVRLLLWTCVCFAGLALNNVLLFLDLEVVHEVDLALARHLTTLASVLVLVCGMIWDKR